MCFQFEKILSVARIPGNTPPSRRFAVRSSPTGGKPMGFFTKDIKTLDDLFVHTLRDIYYAEQQIAKNLPDMIEKATDQTLKNGFETHLVETKGQIVRIEKVFQMHGVEVKGVDCPAIDGILDE